MLSRTGKTVLALDFLPSLGNRLCRAPLENVGPVLKNVSGENVFRSEMICSEQILCQDVHGRVAPIIVGVRKPGLVGMLDRGISWGRRHGHGRSGQGSAASRFGAVQDEGAVIPVLSDRNGSAESNQPGEKSDIAFSSARIGQIELKLARRGKLAEEENSPMLVYLIHLAEMEAKDLAGRLARQHAN